MAEITITKDRQELERLEGIIERNLQSFYEVGHALMEIRDKGYYRDVLGFETFEAYCKAKWDMGRNYANKLIASASVVDVVGTIVPIAPATESQARPLVRLEPEKQREAWQKAVETAPEGKVTAAHVQKVVKAYQLKGGEGGDDKNRFSESTVSVDFGTIDAPEEFVLPFEAFYRQVQIARKERWTRTKRAAARICVKMLNDLIEN